ncbi:MAG: acyltransferase [Alphaproteobacteria bacterium]
MIDSGNGILPNSEEMRRDHRPYWLRSTESRFAAWWMRHFLAPQFEALGDGALVSRPWHVQVMGPGISAGRHVHIHAEKHLPVRLSTWAHPDRPQPRITIGDFALIMPGAMVNAALEIEIGEGSMLASQVMISDSDWHDRYDRTREPDTNAPVRLARNVWVGLRAIICKGVSIGENAIVGAGAVVTHDVPANTIAAGNPARQVGELDPGLTKTTRAAMFANPTALKAWAAGAAREAARGNTTLDALRALLFPKRGD